MMVHEKIKKLNSMRMKILRKIIVAIFVISITTVSAKSQFLRFGPKVGISAAKAVVDESFSYDGNQLTYTSGDRKVGFHAGLFGRVTIASFYLQPEVMFSSVKGQINIDGDNNLSEAWDLSYNKIEVPVLVGKSFGGILHIDAGPVFNYMLTNDAREGGILDEVKQNYNQATVGYQVGFGFDISDITLDFRYEGNLSKLGDSVNFGSESFNTDLRDNMFIVAIGLNLF